jgi:hemin uptake protein HemP
MDANQVPEEQKIVSDRAASDTLSRGARCVRSDELFHSEKEIIIEHLGAHYRLRITQHGKLILTK